MSNKELANDYLEDQFPLEISRDWQSETTLHVAKLKELGFVSTRDIASLLGAHLCITPAQPDFDDLVTVVSELNPVKSAVKPARFSLELFQDIELDLSTTSLVQNLLDHGAMSVIYGESNSGKTFFALDLTLHIALGKEWHGRRVESGGVIYVAAEGGRRIKDRIVAFRKAHSLEGQSVPFYLARGSIDLLDPKADKEALIAEIEIAKESLGVPVRIVVIDTLARAISGGDENSSKDMGAFVRNVDAIRNKTNVHLSIVHHSGKDRAKGARGHSSLRAATDTEIEVGNYVLKGSKEPIKGIKVAKLMKQRDHDAGTDIGFRLETVELGLDAYGDSKTSCVVRGANLDALHAFKELDPNSWEGKALKTLQNLVAEMSSCRTPTVDGIFNPVKVLRETWRERFIEEYCQDLPTRQGRQSRFKRASDAKLVASGHFSEEGKYVWI